MAHPIRLKSLKFHAVPVTERTEWTFAEVSDGHTVYIVEVTAGGATKRVVDHLTQMMSKLGQRAIDDESMVAGLLGIAPDRLQNDHSLAVAVSSLRTAVVGLQAGHSGQGLTEFLGGEPQNSVPLYANINRSLLGARRTPGRFCRGSGTRRKRGLRHHQVRALRRHRPRTGHRCDTGSGRYRRRQGGGGQGRNRSRGRHFCGLP